MYSGWWNRADGIPLNFLKVFSPQRFRPDYSNQRVWRVFTKFARKEVADTLPMYTDAYADDYPFSIEVDPMHKLDVKDIMDIQVCIVRCVCLYVFDYLTVFFYTYVYI